MAEKTTFVSIAGSNGSGIVALDAAGGLTTLENSGPGTPWRASAQNGNGGDKFDTICGSMNGVVGYKADGSVVKFLTVAPSQLAVWKTVPAPGIAISCMAGSPSGMLVACGGKDGTEVKQIDMHSSTLAWKDRPAAPEKVIAVGVDASQAIVVVGNTSKGGRLFKLGPADETWSAPLEVPFLVQGMCGDPTTGFILYGEGQLASVADLTKPHTKLAAPPFLIKAMTGNPKDGVATLAGDGDFVVYCTDFSKPAWIVASGPLVASTQATPGQ